MFGRSFKAAKCKTTLRLAISRIKLMRNKRDVQLKQMRRDLALLLQSGQDSSARIRVEHVIREQNIMAAYEIIELFCELIVARLPIIESQKNCPIDLREAVSSLIFAAPRCADIPELLEIRSLFGSKYGKEFVASAAELRPDCGVNRLIIEKLSVRAPGGEVKLNLMKEIAKEHQVEWDPAESEANLLKLPEDLLDGPSKFVGATKMPAKSDKEPFNSVSGQKYEPEPQIFHNNAIRMPSNSTVFPSGGAPSSLDPSMAKISSDFGTSATSVEDSQHENERNLGSFISSGNAKQEQPPQVNSGVRNIKPADSHLESFGKTSSSAKSNTFAPKNVLDSTYDSPGQSGSHRMDAQTKHLIGESSVASNRSNEIGSFGSRKWDMNFKDTASAAQAAAHSAEKASAAARAAAELSSRDRLLKKGSAQAGGTSFSSSSSKEQTSNLNDSRVTRKSSSNDFMQSEKQSFDDYDFSGKQSTESHVENAIPHKSVSCSGQKATGEVDSEDESPMKRTSRLDHYPQLSHRTYHDSNTAERRFDGKGDGKEERHYFNRQDSKDSNSGEESLHWRRETRTSYPNSQLSGIFDGSESDEDIQLKGYELEDNSSSMVNKLPRSDSYSHGALSDTEWSPQNTKNTSAPKSSFANKAHNNLYRPSPAFEPPKRSPPRFPISSPANSQSLFSKKNILNKDSIQAVGTSFNLSSSDEEMDDLNDSRVRRKSNSNDFVQAEKQFFDAYDHSGRHSHAENDKSQQNARWQKQTIDVDNDYDVSMKRTSKLDPYEEPSNKIYSENNLPNAEKFPHIRRGETHSFGSRGGPNRQDTDVNNSVEESPSRRGQMMQPHTNTRSSVIFDDSDSTNSEDDKDTELQGHEDSGLSKVNVFRHFDKSSPEIVSLGSKSWSSKMTEKVSAPKSSSVTETHHSAPEVQPLKPSPASVPAPSQSNSQSSFSSGESKSSRENSSRGSHVHPKLPDYDDLAARFASMKSNRQ